VVLVAVVTVVEVLVGLLVKVLILSISHNQELLILVLVEAVQD
jgi:uncharacterized membrane protein